MVARTRAIRSTPDRVWDVLADGWLYPLWMVGATAMQEVGKAWPRVGATLVHRTGSWPLALVQTTTVVESVPEHRLVLAPRVRLVGGAYIAVTLQGVGDGTRVRLDRQLRNGIHRFVPEAMKGPLLNAWADDCLERLSFVVERRR